MLPLQDKSSGTCVSMQIFQANKLWRLVRVQCGPPPSLPRTDHQARATRVIGIVQRVAGSLCIIMRSRDPSLMSIAGGSGDCLYSPISATKPSQRVAAERAILCGKPQLATLVLPIQGQASRPLQFLSGKFQRLSAVDDRFDDVRCEECKA